MDLPVNIHVRFPNWALYRHNNWFLFGHHIPCTAHYCDPFSIPRAPHNGNHPIRLVI